MMRLFFPSQDRREEGRVTAKHFDPTLGIVVPDGYDAQANCDWARQNKVSAVDLFNAAVAAMPGSGKTIRKSGAPLFEQVGTGGAMDYKRGGNKDLRDLGNYNFGYVAYCAGLSEVTAKAMGGGYQILSDTSSWEFWDTWFDDPRDQEMIIKGYRDAKTAADGKIKDRAASPVFKREIEIRPVQRPHIPERLPVYQEDNRVEIGPR
jgi:hypothetical protein